MRDPVMEAFDRVSAARERDHECECNCADTWRAETAAVSGKLESERVTADHLRTLARELAEALDAEDDPVRRRSHRALLSRARTAGLLP